jgi:sulfotransferase family protein
MLWCLGMYASGSTWVFNAAMKICAAVSPEVPVVGCYVTTLADLDLTEQQQRLGIVKTHNADDEATNALQRPADAILMSVRDPRDCVTSLMLYQRYRVPQALEMIERSAQACARFAADPRAVLLRYEDGFIDDPATLDKIAASIGGPLANSDRARIFAELCRPAIERHIAALHTLPTALRHAASGDVVDLATQWHSHHANRSGEVGRWRHMLTLAEVAVIEQRLRDWMAAFDYPMEVVPYTRAVGSGTLRI